MTNEVLIAGFGGQGVLFAGKFLAYLGLNEEKQLSWLPSYGPEMRGGTANCSVIISDEPVCSPIVTKPNILIVMNLPSLDKYEKDVVPGGLIIADSSLIDRKVMREDVKTIYIPATNMAMEINAPTLANMIIVGKLIKETNIVSYEGIDEALKKIVSARHQDLLEINKKAVEVGYNF